MRPADQRTGGPRVGALERQLVVQCWSEIIARWGGGYSIPGLGGGPVHGGLREVAVRALGDEGVRESYTSRGVLASADTVTPSDKAVSGIDETARATPSKSEYETTLRPGGATRVP